MQITFQNLRLYFRSIGVMSIFKKEELVFRSSAYLCGNSICNKHEINKTIKIQQFVKINLS